LQWHLLFLFSSHTTSTQMHYFFCHLRWVARRLGGGLCSCNSLQHNKTTSIINSKT
jgi:hypothetical protein